MSQLRITEIFCSLQGESRSVGLPTVFVRLTGCPLRCRYCDTAYAFKGGEVMSQEAILATVADFGVAHVTVTGGEPLAQKSCLPLLTALCDAGYSVSLETSGSLSVKEVDPRVICVMDVKTPDSGEVEKNLWSNLDVLRESDQLKFVICSRDDYDWAKSVIERYKPACEVLISPSFDQQDATELADWVVEDRLPVRFQTQLHKLLWGDKPGV